MVTWTGGFLYFRALFKLPFPLRELYAYPETLCTRLCMSEKGPLDLLIFEWARPASSTPSASSSTRRRERLGWRLYGCASGFIRRETLYGIRWHGPLCALRLWPPSGCMHECVSTCRAHRCPGRGCSSAAPPSSPASSPPPPPWWVWLHTHADRQHKHLQRTIPFLPAGNQTAFSE